MLRLVLDTNVWLDWLVFDDPAIAPVKAAVAEGRAAVFIDDAVESELVRVLAYPFGSRTLDAQAQAAAIAACLRIARRAEGGSREPVPARERRGAGVDSLPKCDDADDQKFLELAAACGAGFLLTRDDALLELDQKKTRPLPFRVVTPLAFAADNLVTRQG